MKAAVIILLSILLLVVLLLCVPVNFYIEYKNEQFFVKLKYLFFAKRLVPKQKSEKKKEDTQKEKSKDKKKEPFLKAVSRFLKTLSSLVALSKKVLSLHRAKYFVSAKVGGEDAADAAINVGKTNAALYSGAAILENLVIVKKSKISVIPDYDSKDSAFELKARFYSYPICYVFNIHKILPLLFNVADAFDSKN